MVYGRHCPAEHLYVKEIHYNQHGLMLLEGKGIYRLNDKWYSVQAGDVIWMAPFVTQWRVPGLLTPPPPKLRASKLVCCFISLTTNQ